MHLRTPFRHRTPNRLLSLALVAAIVVGCGEGTAQRFNDADITVANARLVTDDGTTGSVYLRIRSVTNAAVVAAVVAGDHTGDVQLRDPAGPVHQIDLLAGEEIILDPGGTELAVTGLDPPASPGDTVAIDLQLHDGSFLTITVDVRDEP